MANLLLIVFSVIPSSIMIHKLQKIARGIKEKTPNDQFRVFGSVREGHRMSEKRQEKESDREGSDIVRLNYI